MDKKCPSICIFSNFLINNPERLQRLKDSFKSFKKINPNEWILNIRGDYKDEAAKFLKRNIKKNLKVSHRASSKGWIYDSKILSKQINADYVFIWLEDHIFLNDIEYFQEVLQEMYLNEVDTLCYTWFHEREREFFYSITPIKKGKYIDISFFDENKRLMNNKSQKFKNHYVIGMPSIMRRVFFNKILDLRKPYFKRWPKKYPFDFEKKINDCNSFDIRIGRPKLELFASIDDDHNVDSYSLISRGLYPRRITRNKLIDIEYKQLKVIKKIKLLIPKYLLSFVQKTYKLWRRFLYTISYFL